MKIPPSLIDEIRHIGLKPNDIVFYINSHCNLRCRHCYLGNALLDASVEFDFDSIETILCSAGELERLTVLGGEPLLHPQFPEIHKLMERIVPKESRVTTNLTNIKALDLDLATRSKVRFCVSLDGDNAAEHESLRGKNTFAHTTRNLKTLVGAGVDVEIVHTVTKRNVEQLPRFLQFCASLGVKRVNLHSLTKKGNALASSDLWLTPTEWRVAIGDLSNTNNKNPLGIQVRFERRYLTEAEYQEIQSSDKYKGHAFGSYYSKKGGHRIVIFPDRRVYISSEAFGTEAHIGTFDDHSFTVNSSSLNELDLAANHADHISRMCPEISGDVNFPIVTSVSNRTSIML